jgi:hypothetical protein
MTDFEKNTTTEAMKKEQPAPRPGSGEIADAPLSSPTDAKPAEVTDDKRRERTDSDGVEREHEPDSQSNF